MHEYNTKKSFIFQRENVGFQSKIVKMTKKVKKTSNKLKKQAKIMLTNM